jgi:hypothetical protein
VPLTARNMASFVPPPTSAVVIVKADIPISLASAVVETVRDSGTRLPRLDAMRPRIAPLRSVHDPTRCHRRSQSGRSGDSHRRGRRCGTRSMKRTRRDAHPPRRRLQPVSAHLANTDESTAFRTFAIPEPPLRLDAKPLHPCRVRYDGDLRCNRAPVPQSPTFPTWGMRSSRLFAAK